MGILEPYSGNIICTTKIRNHTNIMEFFKFYMGKYAACIPIMGIIISKIGKNSVTSFGILISKIKYYHR